MSVLANSEDPDEMPHYVAFHQSLSCLLRQKVSSAKEMQFYLENHNLYNIYNIDYPMFIVSKKLQISKG